MKFTADITRQALRQMVSIIVAGFHPDKIILFGSRARGTSTENSDVDLLVVMPVLGSKRRKQLEIRSALHNIPIAKDIVVATPGEVSRFKDIPGTIIRPAILEGSLLYEKK